MRTIARDVLGVALWLGIVANPGVVAAQAEAPPLPERSELAKVVDHAEDGNLELIVGPPARAVEPHSGRSLELRGTMSRGSFNESRHSQPVPVGLLAANKPDQFADRPPDRS